MVHDPPHLCRPPHKGGGGKNTIVRVACLRVWVAVVPSRLWGPQAWLGKHGGRGRATAKQQDNTRSLFGRSIQQLYPMVCSPGQPIDQLLSWLAHAAGGAAQGAQQDAYVRVNVFVCWDSVAVTA